MKKKFLIGTRGSELALAQTKIVKSLLESRFPDYEFEIKIIVTTGDKDLSTNWGSQGVSIKNFFTKEIEKELLEGDIDFAVHSMKDMPSILPNGLIMAGVPIREDNRDIFISKNSQKLMELPPNPIIGTSSLRRSQCIKQIRPDAIIKPLRGNIHTRIRKLYEEDYDGIVLAGAGLLRTGMSDKITEFFDIEDVVPAPAQGALCIEYRENDEIVKNLLDAITDLEVTKIIEAEREFSKIFDGGCHTPIGCSGKIVEENGEKYIELFGMYSMNGKVYKRKMFGKLDKNIIVARLLASLLKGDIDG